MSTEGKTPLRSLECCGVPAPVAPVTSPQAGGTAWRSISGIDGRMVQTGLVQAFEQNT